MLGFLKNEANRTTTENGAETLRSFPVTVCQEISSERTDFTDVGTEHSPYA